MKIAIVVCALLAREAWGQSPRAGGPAPSDSGGETRIGVDANLAGNLARGFVDRDLVAARGIVQGWTGPWGVFVQPYWLYGRVGTPMGKADATYEGLIVTGTKHGDLAVTFGVAYKNEWRTKPPVSPGPGR